MLSPRFFSCMFLFFLACPYLAFLGLEHEFVGQEPEMAEVTYEPFITYWDGQLPLHIEEPQEVTTGTYLFQMVHPPHDYGKSGLFLWCTFDDRFYNVRKVRLNISFTDTGTDSKYFTSVRIGVGYQHEEFKNLSKRAKEGVFVYDYGESATWDFTLRDYIHLKRDTRGGEYLCFILEMYDNGDAVSYFDATDTVTLRVDVLTVDMYAYYGAYVVFTAVVLVAICICDLYMLVVPMDFSKGVV